MSAPKPRRQINLDNRHSLTTLILFMVERAERDSLVALFFMNFKASWATWADAVLLVVGTYGSGTLQSVGSAVATGVSIVAAASDFPACVADDATTKVGLLVLLRS
jgi:hypothetical protein